MIGVSEYNLIFKKISGVFEKTFSKTLDFFYSAAYITIGLLLDNEGQSWNDLGLTPDVDAALSSDEQNAYYDYTVDTDPQISKALNTAKMLSGQN